MQLLKWCCLCFSLVCAFMATRPLRMLHFFFSCGTCGLDTQPCVQHVSYRLSASLSRDVWSDTGSLASTEMNAGLCQYFAHKLSVMVL